MPAKNKIPILSMAFISGFAVLDGYTIMHELTLTQKHTQLNLQIVRNTANDENNYNSFAEFPDNDIPFDIYSRLTVFNSTIPDNPNTAVDIHKSSSYCISFSNNIIQGRINVCNVDLPPPFLSA